MDEVDIRKLRPYPKYPIQLDPNKGYLRKDILADIGQNLADLRDIRSTSTMIDLEKSNFQVENKFPVENKVFADDPGKNKLPGDETGKKVESPVNDSMTGLADNAPKNNLIENVKLKSTIDENKSTVDNKSSTLENKSSTLENKSSTLDKNKSTVDDLVDKNKNPTPVGDLKNKIKSGNARNVSPRNINARKVIRMNDEEVVIASPELRRLQRKTELEEMRKAEQFEENMRKAAQMGDENRKKLEALESLMAHDKEEIKNDFNLKFGDLGNKFGSVENKLKETCDGIDCIKKDLQRYDYVECPECKEKVVPPKSSFCPECGAKIHQWFDDEGKPVVGWKPKWLSGLTQG